MKRYRRNYQMGATYFFTICLEDRNSDLLITHIQELRTAFRKTYLKMPFITDAMVIMPDHIHALWTMPPDDSDFSTRIRLFKSHFSRNISPILKHTLNNNRLKHKEVGIWQQRFWEHTIYDDADYQRHMDYIHFNPIKHGLVKNLNDWEYSTFHREVANGHYPKNWTLSIENTLNFGE